MFEPTRVKAKSLKFATEAAITILQTDDLVKLHPDGKDRHRGYEDGVHSRVLGDGSDFCFIYSNVSCNCLIPCI